MSDILQWNCKGLRARTEELKVLIHDFNPGIICLQETMLGDSIFNPGLNFNVFNSPPPTGERAHGGASVIIHKSLQHSPIPLDTPLQAVALSVLLNRKISVCSLYLLPSLDFDLHDLQSLVDQLPVPFLLLGDFNAHSPLWGRQNLDNKGKVIEDLLDRNDIALFNDGSMIFHSVYNNRFCALDLSISSSCIHLDFHWSVNDYLNGSDHFPIHLRYAQNVPSESPPKWKVEEAHWIKFSDGVNLVRDFESFD